MEALFSLRVYARSLVYKGFISPEFPRGPVLKEVSCVLSQRGYPGA